MQLINDAFIAAAEDDDEVFDGDGAMTVTRARRRTRRRRRPLPFQYRRRHDGETLVDKMPSVFGIRVCF